MQKAPLIILMFLVLCASKTFSAENKVLVVGVSTGYPPYYYTENGKLIGVCIELVDMVGEALGIEIAYQEFPWKRLLASARGGQVDAIMPLFKTREREEFLYFDNLSIALETNVLFTWQDNTLQYNGDFSSIKPYRIGVIADYSYGKRFNDMFFPHKITTVIVPFGKNTFRFNG